MMPPAIVPALVSDEWEEEFDVDVDVGDVDADADPKDTTPSPAIRVENLLITVLVLRF